MILDGVPAFAAAGVEPVVDTTCGRLRGRAADKVQIFRGVRYGASTAGRNRFRPPQPVPAWTGVRDAFEAGSSAPQPPAPINPATRWYYQIETTSEDCLFLDVYTPRIGRDVRRPVMVWLHGGAWTMGAGTAPGFDGRRLAHQGDVVVVTVNHRLNVFGHVLLDASGGDFADAANAGVLDMVAALEWVRDNIEGFGGDPGNVTVFGQSGGGSKVAALMACPVARGLFHKCIVQSCSGSLRLAERAEAAGLAHALAMKLGFERVDGEALQRVPAERLIAALGPVLTAYRPIVDDRTFARHPFDPDAAPTADRLPLLIGNTAGEVTVPASADLQGAAIDSDAVLFRAARLLHCDPATARPILRTYAADRPGAATIDLLSALASDYRYIRNTRRLASLQASHGRTYTYLFDWRTPLGRSPHTVEIPFVFGTTRAASALLGSGPDLEVVTDLMISTWAGFARTGDPNNGLLPRWPRFDAPGGPVMSLNRHGRVAADPGAAVRASMDGLPFYEYNMAV